ncbi:hypothetical protein FQR65_LT02415 [Abscondita terminalis]|nr:hypothetical protein FQR65_LT02415 [Abscondita terminalis]
MNQAEISHLVSRLRIKVNPRLRKLRNPEGPLGRLKALRKTVTALIKHERIELNYPRADEARMYAERSVVDFGCNKIWRLPQDNHGKCRLLDNGKQLIHKLFKVLAPRYENYYTSYTRMYRVPRPYPGPMNKKAVLELRGNPYPPLIPDKSSNRNLIHNVLLDEAKKEYRALKYAEIAAKIELEEKVITQTENSPKKDEGTQPEESAKN